MRLISRLFKPEDLPAWHFGLLSEGTRKGGPVLSEGYACGVLAMFFAAPLKARFCGRYFGALFSSGKALFLLYDRKYICTYAHIYVLHTHMPYRAGRF